MLPPDYITGLRDAGCVFLGRQKFLHITDFDTVMLISVANFPSLGPPSDTFAQVVIEANDNANGVLSLSTSAISVDEQTTNPFLYVNRTAGSFGEVKVSVFFGEVFLVLNWICIFRFNWKGSF